MGCIFVEGGGLEVEIPWCGMSQMRNGRIGNFTSPGVLDGHDDAQLHADIPDNARFSEATHPADLEVDRIHCPLIVTTQDSLQAIHALIQDYRMVGVVANNAAFLIGFAGLFDIDSCIRDRGNNPDRIVLAPAAICVSGQFVADVQLRSHFLNTLNVRIRVRTNLHLKLIEALFLIGDQFFGHCLGLGA